MENIICIHGGMQGGWCWERVRPFLESDNVRVFTPCLSGLGSKANLHGPDIHLSAHIQDIVTLIDDHALQNVTLVGHSYGGMVASGVAALRHKVVTRLIYLDGVLAEPGQSMATAIYPDVWNYIYQNALRYGNGWEVPAMTVDDYGFIKEEDKAFVTNKSTPQSLASFMEPLDYPSELHHTISSIYIKCMKETCLSTMEARAQKMEIPYIEINTGHFPMIEEPELLATCLLSFQKA